MVDRVVRGPPVQAPTPFVIAGPDKLPHEPCLESSCPLYLPTSLFAPGVSLQRDFISASPTPFALPTAPLHALDFLGFSLL